MAQLPIFPLLLLLDNRLQHPIVAPRIAVACVAFQLMSIAVVSLVGLRFSTNICTAVKACS